MQQNIRVARTTDIIHYFEVYAIAAAFEGKIVVVDFTSFRPLQQHLVVLRAGSKG